MAEKNQQNSYDAFISYSRVDREFAIKLEKALESYKPPSELKDELPMRHLNIFRDEEDLIGTDYYDAIDKTLSDSPKLILLCSPASRKSKFVNDEIERFINKYGADDIIPIIVSGLPNNEAGEGQDDLKAFPDILTTGDRLPLAIDYSKTNWQKENLKKGVFKGRFFTLLANIYGIKRDQLEEREVKRERRNKRIKYAIAAIVILLLAFGLLQQISRKNTQRYASNYSQAKVFEEKAGRSMLERTGDGYQRAWLYTLAALKQNIGERSRDGATSSGSGLEKLSHSLKKLWGSLTEYELRESIERLSRSSISDGASLNQLLWRSPKQSPQITDMAVLNANTDTMLITSQVDGSMKMWDMSTGAEIDQWIDHSRSITDMALSENNKLFATTSMDSMLYIYKIDARRAAAKPHLVAWAKHASPVLAVEMNEAKKQIMTFAADSLFAFSLKKFGRASFDQRKDGQLAYSNMRRVAAFPIEKYHDKVSHILSNGKFQAMLSNTVIEWPGLLDSLDTMDDSDAAALDKMLNNAAGTYRRVTDSELTYTIHADSGSVNVVKSPNNMSLGLNIDGKLRIFERDTTGQWHKNELFHPQTTVDQFTFLTDSLVITFSHDFRLSLWDIFSGQVLASTPGHGADVNCVVYPNKSSHIMASGADDGVVILWDTATAEERHRLVGSPGVVLGMQFSGDDSLLAVTKKNGIVEMWNVTTGSLRFSETFMRDSEKGFELWDVAFGAADSILALGFSGADEQVRLYRLRPNGLEFKNVLDGHTGTVLSLAFSPDKKRLISSSRDRTLALWDLQENELLMRWKAHDNQVFGVAYHPKEDLVASVSKDETVRVWNLKALDKLVGETGDYSNPPFPLSIDMSTLDNVYVTDKVIFTPFDRGKVLQIQHPASHHIWRLEKEKIDTTWSTTLSKTNGLLAYRRHDQKLELRYSEDAVKLMRGHIDEVWDVAFSPDGDLLATGSGDNSIRIWHTKTAVQVAKLYGHARDVFGLAFSPDRTKLVSASFDHTVRLWDVKKAVNRQTFFAAQDTIRAVAFKRINADTAHLAFGGLDNQITVLRVNDEGIINMDSITRREFTRIQSLAFHPTQPYIAYGAADDRIRLWRYTEPEKPLQLLGHAGDGLTVAFHPDGSVLASGSSDGKVRLWRVRPGIDPKEQLVLSRFNDKVRSVSFSPNGDHMAVGASDKIVRVWDIQVDDSTLALTNERRLQGHTNGVWGVAFSPNNEKLASGSWDGTVNLWSVSNWDKIASLRGHRGPVTSVDFVSDSVLVSASLDQTIRLWNLKSLTETEIFSAHSNGIYSIALETINNDSTLWLASGASDNSVRLFNLREKTGRLDHLNHANFDTMFSAFEYVLPFELRDNDLIGRSPQLYFVSQNGYTFAQDSTLSFLHKPRPDSLAPLDWVRSSHAQAKK